MFDKQTFENELYDFVTSRVNKTFPQLSNSGSEILKAQRQMLQAIHFVIEEIINQITYGYGLTMLNQPQKETK
jgi:hypothetical protein